MSQQEACEVCGVPATAPKESAFSEPPGVWHWVCAEHTTLSPSGSYTSIGNTDGDNDG